MQKRWLGWVIAVASASLLAWLLVARIRARTDAGTLEARWERCTTWVLIEHYQRDEAQADTLWKGKSLRLGDCGVSEVKADESGERYVSIHPIVFERERFKTPIRCYLLRPDEPMMETDTYPGLGVQAHDVKGICIGKIRGAIVLKDCFLVGISVEGADW